MGYCSIKSFSNLALMLGWVLLCLLATPLAAGNMHVILVGDTAAQELKASIVVDLQTIENHAIEVAANTNLTLGIQRLVGRDACSQVVLERLVALETQSDDVVWFYFSGHGYRTPSKESNPWPNIYFAGDQTGIDLYEIGMLLKNKSAHLALVVADCCNSSLPNHLAPPVAKAHLRPQLSPEKIKQNFKKLFLDTNGLVLIASSKAGQPSWSTSKGGSLYTCALSDSFKTYIPQTQTDMLDWQPLLDQTSYKASQLAKKNGISQDPIYFIEIAR